jgi:hypothetical protein
MTDVAAGAHRANTTSDLTGGRRTTFTIAKALTALFVLGVVVNFFLAGLGTFGVKGHIDDEKATSSFDPHRMVGSILTLISLLVLVFVAIARPGGRALKLAGALFVLMILQNVLAATGTSTHVLGAFHALNGLLILGVAGLLASDTGALRRPH